MPKTYYDIINEVLFFEQPPIKPHVAIDAEAKKTMNERMIRLRDRLIPESIARISDKITAERLTKQDEQNYLYTLQAQLNALTELLDDEKKAKYDATILAHQPTTHAPLPSDTVPPKIQVEIAGNTKGLWLLPLVPIAQITQEFNQFKTDKTKVDKPSSGRKYQATDFDYRQEQGPPPVHIFIFPDKASAEQFIKNLFDKEMASLPDNTKDMKKVGELLNQQESAALNPTKPFPLDEEEDNQSFRP